VKRFASVIFLLCVPVLCAEEPYWPQPLKRDDLGNTVKFTCVVDKVMQAHKGWVVEEWMIREAAEAGFNIYSPRIGYDKLDAVAQVTAWCEKNGIFHLPWMRGTLGVSMDDPKAVSYTHLDVYKRQPWVGAGGVVEAFGLSLIHI